MENKLIYTLLIFNILLVGYDANLITIHDPRPPIGNTSFMLVDNQTLMINTQCPVPVYGKGKSMLPTLNETGYVIIEQCFKYEDLNVGDIVNYKPEPYLGFDILHRIIWMNETHFQSQGDYNNKADKVQKLSTITGIVVVVIY